LFYRIVNSGREAAAAQNNPAAIPAVSPESTPSAVHPPPEADALATPPKTSRNNAGSRPQSAEHPKRTHEQEVVPISQVDTMPSLINGSARVQTQAPARAPVDSSTQASPAMSAPSEPTSTMTSMRRRAVQESDPGSMPIASSSGGAVARGGGSSIPEAAQNPNAPVLHVAPGARSTDVPPSDAERSSAAASATPALTATRQSYGGPTAGMATWTGKLEKDGTLTINGGTPSTGVLAGAGLPGVPVRVIVDQTNLGFLEMPSAANGYRRLVIKSHARHDKITIHWTVIQ